MGSKGTATQTQQGQSTYSANPLTQGAGAQALGMAQSAASSPFSLPTAPVAGFNPQQQQAFQQYGQLQGMAQPYFNQAQGLFNQSAAPISASQVNNYLNPYAGNVISQLQNVQGQQMQDLTGRATQAAGGVGADRIGVAQGQLANQQSLATGQTLSGIYGSALSAAQQDAQRQQSSAYGIGNLGGAAQNAALQGTQALYGSGSLQQQQNQAQLNAQYQNQLAQLSFPYQNAQFLAGITGGLAGALGGTTNTSQYGQSTPAQPSIWSQLLGAGTAGLGAYGAAGGFGGGSGKGSGLSTGSAIAGAQGPTSVNGAPLNTSTYADGGGVGGAVSDVPEVSGNSNWLSSDPAIPATHLQPSQVQQPKITPLNMSQSGGGSSSTGSDIGKIIGTAAQFLPMMLAQGGAAYPPHYADGGGFPDDPFGDANRQAAYAMLRQGSGTVAPNSIPGGEPPPLPLSRGIAPVGSAENPYRQPDVKADGSPLVPDVPDSASPVNAAPTSGGASPYAGISPAAADTSNANMAAMHGQTYPVPYDVDHQNDPSREFARSPWLALLNAGAGMMGGTSPFAGVNIGKGIQQGVSTLEGQRKSSQEEEGINQRARQLAMEAQNHLDEYTKLKPAEAASIKQRQEQLEESGWQKGAENILTGDVTYFNPRTEESGILKADGTWTAKPSGQTAPGAPGGTPTVPSTPLGTAPSPPPANVPAPYGVSELTPNLEPGASGIGFMGKGSPMAGAALNDTKVEIARQSKSAATLPLMKQDLAAMKLSYATLTKDADKDGFLSNLALQPGANFGDRLERAKQANAIKVAAGQPPAFDPDKIAAAENINKIQQRMGLTFASQISPREAFSGQRIGIESSPGLTNSPQGMRRLIAGFEAAADNATDEHAFFQNYLKKNGTSLGWRQDFEQKNPAERYVVNRLVGTLPDYNQKHIAEDVAALKKDPSPKNVALFNKHYADTASYFLNGRI